MIYQEKLTSFDAKALSREEGLTDEDIRILNAHFELDTLSIDELTNFSDFVSIWFFSLTKNLEGDFLAEKINVLDKISLAINVFKARLK